MFSLGPPVLDFLVDDWFLLVIGSFHVVANFGLVPGKLGLQDCNDES